MTALADIRPFDETAYTVTECPSCHAHTALVVLPAVNVYVCVFCGETGNYTPGGWFNQAHEDADELARAKLRSLWTDRQSVRQFVRYSKERMRAPA